MEKDYRLVGGVFSSVASKYDLMNDLMSIGIHRIWKHYFIQTLMLSPGMTVLDCAGGTGDIAIRILEKCPGISVLVCDNNLKMLECGRARLLDRGFASNTHWICANAENLPFANNGFDIYTISFGLRNTCNVPKTLAESFRILRKNGQFACLEFAPHIESKILDKIYKLYLSRFIPNLGKLITGDYDAYQYLSNSIKAFHTPEMILSMMEKAGFTEVSAKPISNGVAVIYIGWKRS